MRRPEIDRGQSQAIQDPSRSQSRHEVRGLDRTYLINGREMQTLRTIGKFRIVQKDYLRPYRIKKLLDAGLVEQHSLYPRADEARMDVLVLTAEGLELVKRNRGEEDNQAYHSGTIKGRLKKPREVAHDASIYSAYLKEAQEIKAAGGKVKRVILDHELKSQMATELNRFSELTPSERRERFGREMKLPVKDDKLVLPDVRIEYLDAEGREQHKDIEVVTKHYRGAAMSRASSSGFKVVNRDGARTAVRDDHHLDCIGG